MRGLETRGTSTVHAFATGRKWRMSRPRIYFFQSYYQTQQGDGTYPQPIGPEAGDPLD